MFHPHPDSLVKLLGHFLQRLLLCAPHTFELRGHKQT